MKYLDRLSSTAGYPFWQEVAGKTVLEIGPFDGWYTRDIIRYHPTEYTVIEPNKSACKIIEDKWPTIRIFNSDAVNKVDDLGEEFDVVILLGVLYHLPSPIHLLERIVNVCKPDVFLIDILGWEVSNTLQYAMISDEVDNIPGNRYTDDISSGVSMILSKALTIKIMKNLGYHSVLHTKYNETKEIHKFIKIA
jgi:2-polyprenyl-3-methyl-5-hydroxy-6-metoxy-1,4-benzoquinol methylase